MMYSNQLVIASFCHIVGPHSLVFFEISRLNNSKYPFKAKNNHSSFDVGQEKYKLKFLNDTRYSGFVSNIPRFLFSSLRCPSEAVMTL